MRIGVLGAGAIGCFIGGMLVARGRDVRFVGRGQIKADVDEHGLSLADLKGGRAKLEKGRIQMTADAHALADCDVVLVTVKSAQTASVAKELAGFLPHRAVVISFQNGVGNADVLKRELPLYEVLGGIVSFNVVVKGPGAFQQATSGPLVIESSSDLRVAELCSAFEASGIDCELSEDIRSMQWAKLVTNLNNAISALSGAPTTELVYSAGYRRVVRAVATEALAVMRAAGVRSGRFGAIPVTWFPALLGLPSPVLRAFARTQVKIDPNARSSMWEDLSRGRLTEVDYLNGEIVRLAEKSSLPAPINSKIVELVHDIEQAGTGCPQWSAEELASRLGIG